MSLTSTHMNPCFHDMAGELKVLELRLCAMVAQAINMLPGLESLKLLQKFG